MKMNPIITQYKKAVLLLSAVIAMGSSAALFAECKPCAASAALKQSLKDAQAAALAGKPSKPSKSSREAELDTSNQAQICCEYCAKYGINCNARCATCEAGLVQLSLAEAAAAALDAATALVEELEIDDLPASEDQARAAREEFSDICPFPADEDLNAKLQALFNCCVHANCQLKKQGHAAEKCCKQLRHRIHTVKELIEDQIEDSEACCTLLESLIVSQIDASAECCSVIENLIVSQIDNSAACCTLLESLILSQIDQTASCCSVTETVLGDPLVTIASLQDCGIDVLDFVNSNSDDVLTWLKRLYVLMYQVFSCTCCD